MRNSAPFDYRDALRRADEILAFPPAKPHIERVEPVGKLVKRFALPLDLLPTTNGTRGRPGWALAKIKKQIWQELWNQNSHQIREYPLAGRPLVRCIRFSSVEADALSDWPKMAIDKLCCGHERLGYLKDDRPSDIKLVAWWEPGPRGDGFAVIEIYSGEERAI
jgi:hypothetical protein